MKVATCILICFCFSNIWQITFQNLLTRNGHGPPQLTDYKHEDNNDRLYRHYQAIIPTYNLSCCGNIIKWGLDVFDNGSFTLDLQVWRPSPTVDDSSGTGCYSLVGNNRFTNISLSGGIAIVTPSPQDYILTQPGDVLGFYVEEAKNIKYNTPGVVLRTNPSYLTSEIVWFASLNHEAATSNSQNEDCPYSVGSNGGVLNTLTRAAPVISISITSVPCSPSPAISSQTSIKSILPSMHTPSNNITSSSKTTIVVESTLSINNNISFWYNVSSGILSISKSTINKTNKPSSLPEKKIILIVSAVIPTFTILIIIVTFVIVILLRSRKISCKGKQREPWECVSQQGISNQAYFEPEIHSQTNEAGIEIVPAHNGEAVIYHCIGPSTSSGKATVSDSEQPETHHYFELETLPTHQYTDIDQLSTLRDKDKIAAKSGKSMPVYDNTICSQKFQDSKECESELKDESNETGVHTQTSENSQCAVAK